MTKKSLPSNWIKRQLNCNKKPAEPQKLPKQKYIHETANKTEIEGKSNCIFFSATEYVLNEYKNLFCETRFQFLKQKKNLNFLLCFLGVFFFIIVKLIFLFITAKFIAFFLFVSPTPYFLNVIFLCSFSPYDTLFKRIRNDSKL